MIRVLWKLICMDTTSKIDVNGDAFESYIMVSHSDILPPYTAIKETSMSTRISNMCRKAWYGMTVRFYRRMDSTDSSEIPTKRMKQHNRRKANAIAIGRGRGRAKGQLRRSGVSQARHRKEGTKHIQGDYEIWQELYTVQNECTVDDTDGYDVPDAAQFMKKTTNPITLNLSDITPTKHKLKARNKQEEAKCPTRVRYVSSIKINNDYHEDSEKSPSRLRLLSECTDDSEDSFVVFENSDDELLEACDEYGDATEYLNKMCCLPKDSWAASNNQMNCNSTKYDMQSPLRQRLLSESSIDSEDSFCIVFKSQSDCASDCTINDCNETSFCNQSSQLDNSTIKDESINDNQNSMASAVYNDQDSEELKTKKVSFDLNPVVHLMVKWGYAYRAARKGPWEQMARDNERFKGRIDSIAAVLDPILTNNHRSQVWQKRFAL
ncbi:uncharacterized protein PPP1R15 [Linepithema humile]|uniref:uncharacterized protein PPP1R15 n=1 Tax=Linepithema humile TaxID=83485 RepID=UPI0006230E5E|nr:PREDICTED: uncharacterized protein LOC105671562 [Linepithema humile]